MKPHNPHIYYQLGAWWCHSKHFNGTYQKVGVAWTSPVAAYANWLHQL